MSYTVNLDTQVQHHLSNLPHSSVAAVQAHTASIGLRHCPMHALGQPHMKLLLASIWRESIRFGEGRQSIYCCFSSFSQSFLLIALLLLDYHLQGPCAHKLMPVQVLQLLFSSCETEEECRNVVAECLGHLALLYPSKTLLLVQQQSQVRGQDSSDNSPPKKRRLVWSCHTLHGCQLCKCDTICSLPCACCLSNACISLALLLCHRLLVLPGLLQYQIAMRTPQICLLCLSCYKLTRTRVSTHGGFMTMLHWAYNSMGF